MTFDSILLATKIGIGVMMGTILILKFISISRFQQKSQEYVPKKLLTYFNTIEVYGTDSAPRRKFLLFCNRLSSIFWFLALLLLLSYLIPYIKLQLGFE